MWHDSTSHGDDDTFYDAEDGSDANEDDWPQVAGQRAHESASLGAPLGVILPYALHRAAFYDRAGDAKTLMGCLGRAGIKALDPQGNTALHIAVQRGSSSVITVLLDLGFPHTSATAWAGLLLTMRLSGGTSH
ncbi:MAG: hypothetical protein WDW38_002633 [Sanguina aurantia]